MTLLVQPMKSAAPLRNTRAAANVTPAGRFPAAIRRGIDGHRRGPTLWR